MSTVKTPQEKKRLSYKKDHVVDGGENDKSFRKKWPRKKAGSNRVQRRRIAQVFVRPGVLDADEAESVIKNVRRPKIRKWGVIPLGKAVANRQDSRVRNHGARKVRKARRSNNAFSQTGNA